MFTQVILRYIYNASIPLLLGYPDMAISSYAFVADEQPINIAGADDKYIHTGELNYIPIYAFTQLQQQHMSISNS